MRDSKTILLKGQTIPARDYIHLYDASPYKIINGHLATKIPCDKSFQPKLNILVGQAPKVQVIQQIVAVPTTANIVPSGLLYSLSFLSVITGFEASLSL